MTAMACALSTSLVSDLMPQPPLSMIRERMMLTLPHATSLPRMRKLSGAKLYRSPSASGPVAVGEDDGAATVGREVARREPALEPRQRVEEAVVVGRFEEGHDGRHLFAETWAQRMAFKVVHRHERFAARQRQRLTHRRDRGRPVAGAVAPPRIELLRWRHVLPHHVVAVPEGRRQSV